MKKLLLKMLVKLPLIVNFNNILQDKSNFWGKQLIQRQTLNREKLRITLW